MYDDAGFRWLLIDVVRLEIQQTGGGHGAAGRGAVCIVVALLLRCCCVAVALLLMLLHKVMTMSLKLVRRAVRLDTARLIQCRRTRTGAHGCG